MKHAAIYVRVSTTSQDHRSQMPDLERWAAAQPLPVVWYTDKGSGKTMDRPGWQKLEAAMRRGDVAVLVCWRLDRLGRQVAGLAKLFDDLQQRKINLVSLKDGIDLSTSAGRLMANVLASVAQYETELRGERILAGQAAARAKGKRWGRQVGQGQGVRIKVTAEQEQMIRTLYTQGTPITRIAKATALSRPTIYDVLGQGQGA